MGDYTGFRVSIGDYTGFRVEGFCRGLYRV